MKQQSDIQFIDEKLKKSFENLGKNDELYRWLITAFKDIRSNAFGGIQIPKRLIPKQYLKKYNINNLWKYNLPKAWRLLYSIESDGVIVISIVLEWTDHKKYERIFKY